MAAEHERLQSAYTDSVPWRRWGPYLSERQWGTVREDYGEDGNSWAYFPHSQSRSRAYRAGEDGILGWSDDRQLLCFALALWNGSDPILKERLFGLTNDQGNHGEDVKEYYFYLDSTPTHSYMRGLYKYPQRAFPYEDLVQSNGARARTDHEYELIDTGVFEEDRYFDVFIEYAKAATDDILIKIDVVNRGPERAPLRLLPTLWFRNTWSWSEGSQKPRLEAQTGPEGASVVRAQHPDLAEMALYCEGAPTLRFTENETNTELLFQQPNGSPFVKDGIDELVVHNRQEAVNAEGFGTKAAADYTLTLGPGETHTVRLRLVESGRLEEEPFGPQFEEVFEARRRECDEFYEALTPDSADEDEGRVMRQALSGMLWSKQYYSFDVEAWLTEHGESNRRNAEWSHLKSHDIMSMPDKWEYPWFAVWDSAFHAQALMLVDVDFAKHQLSMFLEDRYLRADGAIPAYEWAFSDVNPPVHAYATLAVFQFEKARRSGKGDIEFLKWMYERLCRNFEWWVERKGVEGRDIFQGGFLGLDNIGVFDRSAELPTGGHLEQSDGTAWMAFYAQIMVRMSLELCKHDPSYEDQAIYFFDRVLAIADALDTGTDRERLWDEEDGFFYDVLRFSDGSATRLKVRSMVGLLPLAAVSVFEADTLAGLPRLREKLEEAARELPRRNVYCPPGTGHRDRRLLSVLDEDQLRRVLTKMLDENEFLSPYGVRSLSRIHLDRPYVFYWEGQEYRVKYLPAESDSEMFGGNSNWRGPIWIPVNYMIVRALVQLYSYYGDGFRIECPTGSGQEKTLFEVAEDIGRRLVRIFLRNEEGKRPVFGGSARFQNDPHWRDHLLFYEYFHGDEGAGIGASHQTGWTGCVATILSVFEKVAAQDLDRGGLETVVDQVAGSQ